MNTIAYKTIGIGVTFSPNLEANINEAARLALCFGSKLVLIHVGETSEEKSKTFTKFLSPFEKKGLKYELLFKSGDPVNVILTSTKEKKGGFACYWSAQKREFLEILPRIDCTENYTTGELLCTASNQPINRACPM